MKAFEWLRETQLDAQRSLGRFWALLGRQLGRSLVAFSLHTLALVGLAVLGLSALAVAEPDLRRQAETRTLEWLQVRQEARAVESGDLLSTAAEPGAVARATAVALHELTRPQAAVAQWLSRRYKVAPEPVARLVQEAWNVGQRAAIEPTLILAIMAVESSFNPFAQSPVGAQGLMQVMTRVHDDKYEAFGGTHAAFDPLTNLRVGAQVLKDCMVRAGAVPDGLRCYVGAVSPDREGGYSARVLGEQAHLVAVARGQRVPFNAPALPSLAAGATTIPPAAASSEAASAAARAAADERLALLR